MGSGCAHPLTLTTNFLSISLFQAQNPHEFAHPCLGALYLFCYYGMRAFPLVFNLGSPSLYLLSEVDVAFLVHQGAPLTVSSIGATFLAH